MEHKRFSVVVVVAVALFLSLSTASPRPKWFELDNYSFDQYTKDFNRVYATAEERELRGAIFTARLEEIKAHNRDTTKTWKEGINPLSDRTDEELNHLNGYKNSYSTALKSDIYEYRGLSVPRRVDWRTQGVVSAVKDQGRCGSCWTFATTETIESHWALATGQLPTLSEQQILDCTPNPNDCGGTGGCRGGTADIAMAQIINKGGIASEWTYPYRSYNGDAFECQYSPSTTPPAAKITGFKKLPSNEYQPLLEAIAHIGPMAINVDASTWHKYESGVFDGCNQTNPLLNHVVQLVGYGVDPREGDYWLVRNSWSPAWGEDGYIRLRRREAFTCGIDLHPGDGTGCKDGPPTVKVCGTCGILYDSSYPIIPTKP